jgi:hypothetical protein
MSRMRTFSSRLLGFLFRHRRERELDEELQSHLRLLAEETVRRGMSPEDAEHAARREFGGLEQKKPIASSAVCPCLKLSCRTCALACA